MNVTLLATPTDFYHQLVHNIRHAQDRISISSLYLGTGDVEAALIETLAGRLRERPDLQVRILLDYSRGQRGGVTSNSVTMLAPLVRDFPGNVELFLFRVPQLSGLKAKLPPPLNETLGVSHAKVYLVDETLILSGANLSADYFTNRQDRYVQLGQCGGLARFYHDFVALVTRFSYKVKLASNVLTEYELVPPHRAHDSTHARVAMKRELDHLLSPDKHKHELHDPHDPLIDTWAFPTVQFSPISMHHDKQVVRTLVTNVPRGSKLQVASGYLNFPPFLSTLLQHCPAELDVIAAAPRANGFYHARGIKGALPMAYSLLEHDFFTRTLHRPYPARMREYTRPDWTFHGKGMWWRPPRVHARPHERVFGLPEITVVGSSNFGQRSYHCDLESNLVLRTRDPALQRRLQLEYDALIRDAEVVTESVWRRPERRLHGLWGWRDGQWIRPVTKLIATYL
ncbi:hypothetical protein PsorP6_012465 [Peronosclerospora sorghi]|uniref:Uncharacterized protein n=1 Tax=Peronosclerospora sorghi TaxID=230839 RepID=A0ACC0WI86_9STRA|nr:hypothetical protein PsorP6_012465 [Peronosclerospora sorghi]